MSETITGMAGSIIEHEARPPAKKTVCDGSFPKTVKFNIKPIQKRKKTEKKNDPGAEMEMESLPAQDEPLTKNAARFDFLGNKLTGIKASDHTYNAGLHNHGDSPDEPGYAIYELALLCRSRNISQRAGAFETLYNIVKKDPLGNYSDLKMVQIHKICVNAYNLPTSITIKNFAGAIIIMLSTNFSDPFSLYPYPAVPMHSQFTMDFVEYIEDIAALSNSDPRLFDALALLSVASKKIDLKFLEKSVLSLELLHFARAAYINWGEVCCQKLALSAFEAGTSIEIMKEAAILLRFHQVIPSMQVLQSLPPIVAIILISRVERFEDYKSFIPQALELAPDPFALEFLTSCALHSLISKDEATNALKDAIFSQPAVVLSDFAGVSIVIPPFPKSEEECWEKRGIVTGIVEYILLHKDYSLLPGVFPCLFSFTNPSADILISAIFGFSPPPQRPVDPEAIFRTIEQCSPEELKHILTISKYFPLHFSGRFFLRKDAKTLGPMFSDFLSSIPDPMQPESIVEGDIEKFLEDFSYDGYEEEAYQKYAIMCITQGADLEVRHTMWTKLQDLASLFTITYERKDHYEPLEDDMDTVHEIIDTLGHNECKMVGPLLIGFNIVQRILVQYKGDVRGQMIMEHVLDLPMEWREKLISI